MKRHLTVLPSRGDSAPVRGGPRPGLVTFRRHRSYPVLGDRIRWPLLFVVLILLGGASAAIVRADEDPEPARYQPSSRGNRAAVLERDEVVDLAAEVFGPEVAQYVANIAWCESRHNRFARSAGWDRFFGWYEYLGLLQVSTMWRPLALEVAGSDDLTDAWVNLMTARAIQRAQGWRAWPVCSR